MSKCKNCNSAILEGDKFCSKCGNEIIEQNSYCPECENEISPTDKFCGSCGYEISNEEQTEIENPNLVVEKTDKVKSNNVSCSNVEYFSVSSRKLVVLSIATLGLYEIYWFYKNWQAVKEQGKEEISPFWRTIFTFIFALGLFERVLSSSKKVGYKKVYNPLVLTVIYILLIFTVKMPDIWFLLSFLSFIPLLTIQKAINFNNSIVVKDYVEDDRFSAWEMFISIIGGILVFLTIFGSF